MRYHLNRNRDQADDALRGVLTQQVHVRVTIPDAFGKPWGWEKAKAQVLNILQNAGTHPILDVLSAKGHSRQKAIDLLMELRERGQFFEVVRKSSR